MTASKDSSTCTHPNANTHPHTDSSGNVTIQNTCPDCGYNWTS